jgi:hypothetical protein
LFFFRPAGGTGDPHFVTLDGLEYSYNGLGEFVLLRAEELDFEIQVQIQKERQIDRETKKQEETERQKDKETEGDREKKKQRDRETEKP